MWTFTTGLIVGILVGGSAAATSARVFGWFNKQVKSVETKITNLPKP